MKNFIKCAAVAGIIASGLACEKKSSNTEPQVASEPAAEVSVGPTALAADVVLQPSAAPMVATGKAVTTSTVVDRQSSVGETPAGSGSMTWEEIMLAYPTLADRILFLGSVDKVVETDAHTFDLYAGGAIVMTLKYSAAGNTLELMNSNHAGFSADLITFETAAAQQSQGDVVDTLNFMMSACNTVQAPQEQEQAQDQTQDKVAPSGKEQDQSGKEQEQSGKEAPTKEEPKKEEPKQVCASIIASIVLKQVVEKQEQAQVTKEQPKEEPKKEEPKQEPKAQEQEQAPKASNKQT